MAVNATFTADFSRFFDQVNKAEVELKDFETSANKVSKSLSAMVDSFSGRKLLEEGAQLNRLFQTTDDLAILTAREFQQVTARAQEAVEKMQRLGIEVPKGLQNIANAGKQASTATQGLHSAIGQFDSALSSVGLNISAGSKALLEITAASSQTIDQLGLLATAGLSVATAFGAYHATRALLDFLGVTEKVDKAVANAAASVLGLGDANKEALGAQQDTINRAIQDGAQGIRNYSDAIKFNQETVRKHMLVVDDSAARIANWRAEIGKVVQRGELQQLQEAIESGAFKTQELTERFKISSGALKLFTDDMHGVTKSLQDAEAAQVAFEKELAASAKLVQDIEQKVRAAVDFSIEKIGQKNDAELRYVNAYLAGEKQIQAMEAENAKFTQQTTQSTYEAQIAAIHSWEDAQIKAFRGAADQLAQFTDLVKRNAQEQLNALTPIVTLIGGGSQSLLRPDTQSRIQQGPVGGNAFSLGSFSLGPAFSLSARASGGPVMAGQPYLVGERGQELFVPSSNGTVVPNGAGATGQSVIQLVVDGRVLAEVVNSHNTKILRQSRLLPPA